MYEHSSSSHILNRQDCVEGQFWLSKKARTTHYRDCHDQHVKHLQDNGDVGRFAIVLRKPDNESSVFHYSTKEALSPEASATQNATEETPLSQVSTQPLQGEDPGLTTPTRTKDSLHRSASLSQDGTSVLDEDSDDDVAFHKVLQDIASGLKAAESIVQNAVDGKPLAEREQLATGSKLSEQKQHISLLSQEYQQTASQVADLEKQLSHKRLKMTEQQNAFQLENKELGARQAAHDLAVVMVAQADKRISRAQRRHLRWKRLNDKPITHANR